MRRIFASLALALAILAPQAALAQSVPVVRTLAPVATRNAGTYTSAIGAVPRLQHHEVRIDVNSLSAADLADPTLDITITIEGNDDPAATNASPGWYAIAMTSWNGGNQAKFQPVGTFAPPDFGFRLGQDINAAVAHGVMTIDKRTTWGVTLTVN